VTVKVGFVGTGGIANAHMSALANINKAKVVACMDVDENRAAQAAAKFPGAAAYTDLAKMLKQQQLDTVYICVPPHAHGEIELALIRKGIPFFTEKPIGNDIETPKKILAALKRKKLLTSVGYMSRYRATVQKARELLAEDEPVLARGGWIGGMPGVMWWRQKKLSGGQMVEQTTHTFDLARYLLGEVKSVYCVGRTGVITGVEKYDVEDASICTMVFKSGMICEISSSCAVTCGGGVSLEIFCRKSRIKVFGWDLSLEYEKPGEYCKLNSSEQSIFEVEDRIWIDAVESGDGSKIKSPYEDALKSQIVTCLANKSIATGKPMKV
jgi:myo-inositol 2-dehydrogenase/D-chiro-inositol 1-dehydrogenase